VCVVKKNTKTPMQLDKMKKGVQDGFIHKWGYQKKGKKTLEYS
jgi:hypothetical protein